MRLYLDANTIIYAIETSSPFRAQVLARLQAVENAPNGVLLTSLLSRLECRVKPLRDGNAPVLALYDTFFTRGRLQVIDIGLKIIDLATDLRSRYSFKTPDAIHLATAIESGADGFLTGDSALVRCKELNVEVL